MPSSPYHPLVEGWRERLRDLMKQKRFNARSLSKAAGLNVGAVSEWLNVNKEKNPQFASLVAVARVLGVPVSFFAHDAHVDEIDTRNEIEPILVSYASLTGELLPGTWRELPVYVVEDTTPIPSIPMSEFEGLKQYAWRVSSNSMNLVVKPGAYVIGIAFAEMKNGREPKPGDMVICERQDRNKYEFTLKRVVASDSGLILCTESDDKRFEKIAWPLVSGVENTIAVRATHLVIGAFRFFP